MANDNPESPENPDAAASPDQAPTAPRNPAPSSAEPAPAPKRRSPFLTGLVAALVAGTLGAGVAGGYAFFSERARADQIAGELEGSVAACQSDKEAVEAKVAALEDRAALLEVRVILTRALDDLSSHNFGTAKAKVERARERYAKIAAAPSADIANGLSNLDIRVTADMNEMESAMNQVIGRIDAALGGS